ncbi:group 1 truncated hemoglobin [Sphingomonas sp. SFZ2018-12]|uniref:group I truncated hemoglobin n=1 Tax=Sphingomonas sp. SFZ2018-12 TaxID=2683197 RepID=UPI001F0FD884|nr:group 1 truncated hemoglobin [Sphingomonas sp. SFZ2018-12]
MTMPPYFLALAFLAAAPNQDGAPPPHAVPGEDAVDPYRVDPANAGARPFSGPSLAAAFHGQAGIRRIVDGLVARAYADPVIGEIFDRHDRVRLSRTLFEQFCYLLNAGCTYSGRDMKAAHKDLGVEHADMNRLVELLQDAMAEEGVSFAAQNKLLSKLAPMRGDVVER